MDSIEVKTIKSGFSAVNKYVVGKEIRRVHRYGE